MLLYVACSPPSAQQPSTPLKEEHQFMLHGVQLTHQPTPEAVWEAQAKRLEGDFDQAALHGVSLHRKPLQAQGVEVHVKAPEGFAHFEEGHAWFTDASLYTPHNQGRITCPKAVFSEATHSVTLEGPVEYRSSLLHIHASKGLVLLNEQLLTLEGPVEGRIVP